MTSEGEVRAEDVVAEKAGFFELLDGKTQTANRDRVLRADVEIAVLRADRVAGDRHAFDDGEGIAFKDRAVHERARVAFVTVADHVLLFAVLIECELPLAAGGESAAAAASEAGGEHFVDDFLLCHRERFLEALESVHAERFVDVFRIDDAAAVKRDTALFLIEIDVVLLRDLLAGQRLDIQEAVNDLAADDVLVDDFFDVFDLDKSVKRVFRIDLDEGAL